jgi:hypothetical protein
MTWTLTTSGAAISKAGYHHNTLLSLSGTHIPKIDNWAKECEGFIEAETRRKWVDNYSLLLSGVKYVLSDVASSKIAMNIIAWDSTGYLPRESDLLMNWNDEIIQRGLNFLKDFKSNTIQTP